MFDYLIAVGVALLGLAVVYTLFSSLESVDTTVVKKKVATSPKPKKEKPSEKKLTKKEKQALKEEEEIIAKELANTNSGMNSDKRDFRATTLDEFRSLKKEKQETKEKGPAVTTFSPKQVLVDKEQGFSVVQPKAKEAKKEKSPVTVDPAAAQREALDKKLSQFFRNNAKKGKTGKGRFAVDEEQAVEGGKVVIKGSLVNSRAW